MTDYATKRARIPALRLARTLLRRAVTGNASAEVIHARRSAATAALIADVIEHAARVHPPMLPEHVDALHAILDATQPASGVTL